MSAVPEESARLLETLQSVYAILTSDQYDHLKIADARYRIISALDEHKRRMG